MKTDGVLFDLDGTLWDSTNGVTMVWNRVAQELCPGVRGPVEQQEVRSCMGLLLPDIGKKLFPGLSGERQQQIVDTFCAREVELLAQTGGQLYPGLRETLESLCRRFPLFIVSNCQDGYIECFLRAHRLERWFTDTENAGRTGLPKAQNIALVVERHGLKAPVYVGDTALDGQSARQAGVPYIFARYGFGAAQDYDAVIDSFDQLAALLEPLD